MDYSFEPFEEALSTNWCDDDPLLKRLLDHHVGREGWDIESMSEWGSRTSGPLRKLADASAAASGALPRVEHFDARGRRVDRIVLPEATQSALAEVQGREGMGALHGNPFAFYAKAYLYGQNGEAGVLCSAGCTDGLVRVLEAAGDHREHRLAVERIRSSTPERVWHGAQFVTERQGGSDVRSNRTRAVPEGDRWRLHGRKWFCSNVNADYFLVTARPENSEFVGLYLVPAYEEPLPHPLGRPSARNGCRVDRLKEKLGTRELATAEITLDGAIGYSVGAAEQGLSNLLRHVLTTSRFYCALSAASTLRRVERIAEAYTGFRTAFGRQLSGFPAVRDRLSEIRTERARAVGCCFELLRLWEEGLHGNRRAEVSFRILLSLCKPVLTMRATRLSREAMILLGGNGIEERFSPLPRLYRDALIMEIWEGPHDVLFGQAMRDLRRFSVDPGAFVEAVVGPGNESLGAGLATLLGEEDEMQAAMAFRDWAHRLVTAFADRSLRAVGEVR